MKYEAIEAGRYDRLHGDEDMIGELDTNAVLTKLADLREKRALELASMTHSQLIENMHPYDHETAFHALLRRWFLMLASHRLVENVSMRDHHKQFCLELAELDISIEEAERAVIGDMRGR